MATVQQEEAWRQLHHQLRGIAKRRAALDAEEARCLREVHHMRLWRRFGYVHMNEYLERELGYGPQVGVERLRVALALAELPEIEASLGEGGLSYSAVRELTRVATPETESSWLEKALGKTLREIEQMISGKKRGARPEDAPNPDLTTRVLRLELMPAALAMFRHVQSALADEHGSRLDDSALIEVLCRRALEGGGSAAQAERPAYQVAITVCEGCGRGWQNGAGREIEVGREVVERARCDAEEIGSLRAEDPERARATVTARVRRQVLARDHHRCTVPGCRSARNLDLHHIEFQEHGGSHEMWNLTVVCSAHHQHLHEGRLTIRGRAPDGLEFEWRERSGGVSRAPEFDAPKASSETQAALDPPSAHASREVGLEIDPPILRASIVRDSGVDADPSKAQGDRSIVHRPGSATTDRPHLHRRIDDRRLVERSLEGRGIEEGSIEARSFERRSIEARSLEARSFEGRGLEGRSLEGRSLEGRSLEGRSIEGRSIEGRSIEGRSIEGRGIGGRSIDKVTDNARAIDEDARTVLVTAGYKAAEAREAVKRARPHVGAEATLEEVIRAALAECAVRSAMWRPGI